MQHTRSRLLAVLAACALALPTACSSGSSSGASSKTVLHWSWLSASDAKVWQQMIDAFNAAHKGGVQIQPETIADYNQYKTKVVAGVSTGHAPDFGWNTAGQQSQWVKDGVIVPLDDLAKQANLDLTDFDARALESSRSKKDGKLYMIPMDAMTMAMEINVPLAKKAGLDPQKPPTTNEEFLKWAKAMTVGQGGKISTSGFLMTGDGPQPSVVWAIVAAQMGFQRTDSDLKNACVNKDAGVQAMQWVLNLFDTEHVSTRDVTDRYKAFSTNQGGLFWTGPWTISGNLEAKVDFISVPIPQIGPQTHNYYELGGLEVYKQKDESRYKATLDAVKWLSDNSFLWTTKGRGASVRSSILNRPDYTTAGYPPAVRQAFITGLKSADLASVPVVTTDDFEVYSGTSFVSQQVAATVAGKQSASDFVTTICTKWQEDLAKASQ